MSLTLIEGPFTVLVPGSLAAWTAGPVFRISDVLRVRASGAIRYGFQPGATRMAYAFTWADQAQHGPGGTAWTLGAASGYSAGRAVIPALGDTLTITSTPGNLDPTSGLPAGSAIVGVELRITTVLSFAGAGGTSTSGPGSSSSVPGTSTSCPHEDEPLLLADGGTVRAGDLRIGDRLASADARGSRLTTVTVTAAKVVEDVALVRLSFEGGSLLCSDSHPLMVRREGTLVEVGVLDLTTEDSLLLEDLTPVRVLGVVPEGRGSVVWLTTDGDHLYFAGRTPVLGHNADSSNVKYAVGGGGDGSSLNLVGQSSNGSGATSTASGGTGQFNSSALYSSGSGGVAVVAHLQVAGVDLGSSAPIAIPTGTTILSLGGPNDLWGRAWSPADLPTLDWDLKATNSSGAQATLGIDGVTAYFYVSIPTTDLPLYAQPEGTYDPGYQPDHPYAPASVRQNSEWVGSPLPVTDTVPLSLAMIVLPDGTVPPLSGHANALRPNRDAFFSQTVLAAAGATDPSRAYRAWFLFNDGIDDFGDDDGSYTVIIDRYAGILMANPIKSLERPQFGVETVYGAGAVASRISVDIENDGFTLTPEQNKATTTTNGFAFSTSEETTTELSRGSTKGMLDYRDFGYKLCGPYGAESNLVLSSSAGVSAVQHIWEDDPFVQITPQSYAFEYVKEAGQRPHAVTGLVFLGLKVDTARDKQADVSTNVIAKPIKDDGVVPSTGANDVQLVTLINATGGTWGLQLDRLSLLGLAFNIPPATLQTQIRALGGIWALATVTGTAGVSYTITNTTGGFVQLITPIYKDPVTGATLLTSGSTPSTASVAVARITMGGMQLHQFTRAMPGELGVYFAASLADLVNAPSLIVDEYETNIDVSDRFEASWRQNPTDVGHAYLTQRKPGDLKDTIMLTMAYNDAIASFIANSKNDTPFYCMMRWVGGLIGQTGQRFSIMYLAHGVLKWDDSSKDSQGNIQSVQFTLNIHMSKHTLFRSRWIIVNDVLNYQS